MIELSIKRIKQVTLLVLLLPVAVFFIGWLKWYWAALGCGTIGISYYLSNVRKNLDDRGKNEQKLMITAKVFIIIVIISLIWVLLSGIGGFWSQSKDHIYRNAIFRDIILREWPVIYPATGHALVYYIGFWLVPALLGKVCLALGGGEAAAYNVGCVALYIWTVLCILLVFCLILYTLSFRTVKNQIVAVVMFIFFSGMDLMGSVGWIATIGFHLEWWAEFYQYSSFTTCLFWVFNQAVPAWLCILLMINEKKVSNYVCIGMVCLFYAPLPFVGIFIYAVAYALIRGIKKIKEKALKVFLKEIFSVQNVLCALILFPVIATYLLSNEAIRGVGSFKVSDAAFTGVREETTISNNSNKNENTVMVITESQDENASSEDKNMLSIYFSFICIEFLFYMIFIWKKYKKNPIFYVTLISLLLIPLFRIGQKSDFSMRVSIPGLVVVFLFCCRFLVEEKEILKKKESVNRLLYILLMVFLLIGAVTPGMEVFRVTKNTIENGIRTEAEDRIYTLGCDGPNDVPGNVKVYKNFVAVDLEKHLFFRVFSK